MVTETITIEKVLGVDMIPYLVQSACHYDASLYIIDQDKRINMKSIMGMSILKLTEGKTLELTADGADEEKALKDLAGCFLR